MQTESGQGYDLDRSLFERLVRQGFPVATLEQQRRMRPCISSLIRETIYPSLKARQTVVPCTTDFDQQTDAASICLTAIHKPCIQSLHKSVQLQSTA